MPSAPRARHLAIAGVSLGLALTGCSSTTSKSATSKDAAGGRTDARTVRVILSNDGCTADPATISAGPVTFTLKNDGGSSVSEAELVLGTKILGEKEGLTPGLSGKFSLDLEPGRYEMYCPHAKTERSTFMVTGSGSATSGAAALLKPATSGYRDYVLGKATEFVGLTAAFAAAVKAEDVAKAKSLYADARAPYEAIEPVAESFGDLDPGIDARAGDVPAASWGGYHRIEQQLWMKNSATGMAPVADKLLSDVKTLVAKIKTSTYQPADLANGATELLTEVGKNKLTGEEERYSRTDLSDIDANLEGSRAAFDLLVPALKTSDPTLVSTIQNQFADVSTLMKKQSDGKGGFRLYIQLTPAEVRALTVAVDALAEPLSQVGEKIVSIR